MNEYDTNIQIRIDQIYKFQKNFEELIGKNDDL